MSRVLIDTLKLAYERLDSSVYHGEKQHVSSSLLKTFDRETPEFVAAYRTGALQSDSEALSIGSACHAIIDGTYSAQYATAPDERGYSSRSTKAFGELRDRMAADGDTRTLLTRDEASVAERCGFALREKLIGVLVGHKQLREPSLFWTQTIDGGKSIRCKCRPDLLIDDGRGGAVYVEIKTAAKISPRDVKSTFWRLGYWLQQAHYEAGILACGANQVATRFLFVRTNPPYDVIAYQSSHDEREAAAWKWSKLLSDYERRESQNDWVNPSLTNPQELRIGLKLDEPELEGFDDE